MQKKSYGNLSKGAIFLANPVLINYIHVFKHSCAWLYAYLRAFNQLCTYILTVIVMID